ncbi:ABC transporter permease [Ponticoccus sp. SC2-23]|uniref:ABC transporter permease n=1 Tax=Alexandriicola marinus TaxID=2081710 RepID=UPI000FD8265B|nr:FtsX-like permease family protein [Alexandriicola marinus]MBM1221397.1 ABC transporter permease [Ponticoccus sp. SC6-9]MBM1226438.1 ABC transporter permease [Ponticoccus sp. SC6-15]MBM1230389.1 ABC transporter permease [Ponticoccus sp. SC6-38]MBM1234912.1 ABC transporter permease [Ponticoccus sp. SC6-45]MBM1239410.1 ABC transporter permease [Ponticoccus sp. SC6-49]MBM1243192.1 ABC transporter permease [Ponticoccus sp. SC2-64]MBM1248436.1 ABC transporter permease [Ponticoccus sp. SC6-42]M
MRYGLKVAYRHLASNLSQTGLLVIGVAVAVFIFIFMSALIGGLADLMVNRTLGGFAHVTIQAEDRELPVLETGSNAELLVARQKSTRDATGIRDALPLLPVIDQLSGVAVSSPQITGGAVLIRGERVRQVGVTGVQPDRVTAIVAFDRYLQEGSLSLTGDGLLIGATLASDMNLSVGSPVTLRTDQGNTASLRVSGIYSTGVGQLDRASAYVDIRTARSLFDIPNAVSRIELKLTDLYEAEAVAARITATTGLDAEPWTATAQQLYEGLRAQSDTGLILKSFALITIVIGVASSLMLTTYRRRPEIGIMRAMGASQGFILFIFVTQGMIVGLVGGLIGASLGLAVLTPLTPSGEVAAGQLPIDVAQGSFGLAIGLTMVGATLAAILPARAASRIDPVEAIGQ